eukprot:CAMPEP_0116069448 /NCGR_PEP_ID=MMETSP0322-20121206/12310_1 /TAXON_ID=163516 /ORGANISM="Leptocylindrus danicus var. apora, Strain B651" /LENGTH=346 /DNA_ID=CAMNT_0003556847 /DNA_START=1 /DNA_END=1041 /DNA_ORIENTATION=+
MESMSPPTINRYTSTRRGQSKRLLPCRSNTKLILCILCGLVLGYNFRPSMDVNATSSASKTPADIGRIVYGAKNKGDETAKYVSMAIDAGFRHIATASMHADYQESGVGAGWKESGVAREDLYLQTLFVGEDVNGWNTKDCHLEDCDAKRSLEDQVHFSIQSSLTNLQTTYIDAVLIHNFRARLQPYDNIIREYRVLEEYVDKGVIRHLGIVSCHDENILKQLYDEARIKPKIIQNRFHGNRQFDVKLRPLFKELGLVNQLFWVLTGNGGFLRNETVKRIAKEKNLTVQQCMYAFTLSIGASPMIGSQTLQHMKEDVDMNNNFSMWTLEDKKDFAGVLRQQGLANF